MALGTFSVAGFVFVSLCVLSQTSALQTKEPCVCVWFYLCVNGTLERYGAGIIDQRSYSPVSCNATGIVCCPLGKKAESPPQIESTMPPTEENETGPKPDRTPNESKRQPSIPTPSGPDPTIDPIVQIDEKPKPVANPVFVPKPGCGVKRVSLNKRISFASLDESIAHFAEFPWMLAVLTEKTPTAFQFQCGASLIHKQVALTAAHCVDRIPVTSLRIRGGEWNTKSTEEPQPHQDRKVSHVELHPFYSHANLKHDIALIFFDHPFSITDNVDTICLPSPNSIFHGSRCTVTGWGKDAAKPHGTYHNILHKVDVPVVPCTECERRFRKTRLGPFFTLHHSFLCAGGEPEKDSCKGDGGGPLVCPTEEENRWVQAGIVSWGIGCGTTNPGVYTDVSVHTGWIQRRLLELEQTPVYTPTFNHFYRFHH